MSHRWFENKNAVKAARDKATRGESLKGPGFGVCVDQIHQPHPRGHLLLNLN
jgi:hypothetical protein